MMANKREYLENVEIFQELSPDVITTVDRNTRLVSHPAGHLFYMPDDAGEVLFILKSGHVQLYKISSDGRKLIIAMLSPGAIFGHMALVGQRLHETYAQSIDDCVICVWNRHEVERLLMENTQFALKLLDAVGQRLSQAEQRLTEITFKRVPARLASIILNIHQEQGGLGVVEGYTHQHLADMMGIYRETTTQTLNDFKQQQLISLGRKRIVILNLEGLVMIAQDQ